MVFFTKPKENLFPAETFGSPRLGCENDGPLYGPLYLDPGVHAQHAARRHAVRYSESQLTCPPETCELSPELEKFWKKIVEILGARNEFIFV